MGDPPLFAFSFDMTRDSKTLEEYEEQSFLIYKCCPHNFRYKFKKDSPLRKYLKTKCKGFVESPDDLYTINYIVIVLLANWGELRLVRCNLIKATTYIQKAFDTKTNHMGTNELRRRIIDQMECYPMESRVVKWGEPNYYYTPFWCPSDTIVVWIKYILACSYNSSKHTEFFWAKRWCNRKKSTRET